MPYEPEMPRYGPFKKLKSFRMAQLIHDVTVLFCDEHTEPRSRVHDQMPRTARAVVRQIAEGSQLGRTSKKLELRQTGMARASLDELRLSYEGFLMQRDLPVWGADDPRRTELIALRPRTVEAVVVWVAENCSPNVPATPSEPGSPAPTTTLEGLANCALALISAAFALLDRQLKAQTITLRREESESRRTPRTRGVDLDDSF